MALSNLLSYTKQHDNEPLLAAGIPADKNEICVSDD